MTIVEFRNANPDELEAPLLSMWWDAHDSWEKAHEIAQDVDTSDGAWVHAYLHRKEGDQSNAAYWYRRAGRPIANGDMNAEWQQIVEELLARREPS
jgi:hypothetical protein